jgi:DNA invertase Pin-like site-specific DNA recombinase
VRAPPPRLSRRSSRWRARRTRDDLSRLSRDLGNTWQTVFRDLATAHVRVIDVSTGMGSDSAGARIQFGALALVNDTMLQIVRSETLRGLEGRALAGFWAGGRVYGYRTVREEDPPDPDIPVRSRSSTRSRLRSSAGSSSSMPRPTA